MSIEGFVDNSSNIINQNHSKLYIILRQNGLHKLADALKDSNDLTINDISDMDNDTLKALIESIDDLNPTQKFMYLTKLKKIVNKYKNPHSNVKVIAISVEEKQKDDQLKMLMNDTKNQNVKLKDFMDNIENEQNEQIQLIQNVFDEIKNELENKKNELIQNIQTLNTNQINSCKEYMIKMKNIYGIITDSSNKYQNMLKNHDGSNESTSNRIDFLTQNINNIQKQLNGMNGKYSKVLKNKISFNYDENRKKEWINQIDSVCEIQSGLDLSSKQNEIKEDINETEINNDNNDVDSIVKPGLIPELYVKLSAKNNIEIIITNHDKICNHYTQNSMKKLDDLKYEIYCKDDVKNEEKLIPFPILEYNKIKKIFLKNITPFSLYHIKCKINTINKYSKMHDIKSEFAFKWNKKLNDTGYVKFESDKEILISKTAKTTTILTRNIIHKCNFKTIKLSFVIKQFYKGCIGFFGGNDMNIENLLESNIHKIIGNKNAYFIQISHDLPKIDVYVNGKQKNTSWFGSSKVLLTGEAKNGDEFGFEIDFNTNKCYLYHNTYKVMDEALFSNIPDKILPMYTHNSLMGLGSDTAVILKSVSYQLKN